jgi:hypothetical protein
VGKHYLAATHFKRLAQAGGRRVILREYNSFLQHAVFQWLCCAKPKRAFVHSCFWEPSPKNGLWLPTLDFKISVKVVTIVHGTSKPFLFFIYHAINLALVNFFLVLSKLASAKALADRSLWESTL